MFLLGINIIKKIHHRALLNIVIKSLERWKTILKGSTIYYSQNQNKTNINLRFKLKTFAFAKKKKYVVRDWNVLWLPQSLLVSVQTSKRSCCGLWIGLGSVAQGSGSVLKDAPPHFFAVALSRLFRQASKGQTCTELAPSCSHLWLYCVGQTPCMHC